MARLGVNLNVLNQKGSPALYTDVFANRPAFGYKGRLFFSTDTQQIFEDTGSAWTLLSDAGSGSSNLEQVTTNGNTTDQGIYITANNLGVGVSAIPTQFPNTKTYSGLASPTESHSYNIGITGTGQSDAVDTTKWGVGVYGAGYTNGATRSGGIVGDGEVTNSADTGSAIGVRGYAEAIHAGGLNIGLYGSATNGASNYALYMNAGGIFSNTTQTWTLPTNVAALSFDSNLIVLDTLNHRIGVNTNLPSYTLTVNGDAGFVGRGYFAGGAVFSKIGTAGAGVQFQSGSAGGISGGGLGYVSIGSSATNIFTVWFGDVPNGIANFSGASISSNTTRTYTLPDADGTLALTSNLSSYLPLSGGTLTGTLTGTSATFSTSLGVKTTSPTQNIQVGDGTQTGNQYIRLFAAAVDMYIGQTGSNIFGAGNGHVIVSDATYTSNFAIGCIGTSSNLVFGTSNLERARIAANGNFLIGTTTSDQLLTISGNISVRGAYSGTYGSLRFGTTDNTYFNYYASIQSSDDGVGRNVSNLQFFTSYGSIAAEAMRLTGRGRLLVGTTSDNGNLVQINGSISIGNTVTAAVGVASTHKVTILIGGVTYYLLASNV